MNFKHFGKRSSRIERVGRNMHFYLESKKYTRENNLNLCLLLDCSKLNYHMVKVSRIKENSSQIFDNPVHYYLNLNTT